MSAIFELKFEFLEKLRKPLALKSTRKRIEEKTKWKRRWKTKQATRKKIKWGVSMPRNVKHLFRKTKPLLPIRMTNRPLLETIWFPKTPKKEKYIRTPFAVLVQGKTRQTN